MGEVRFEDGVFVDCVTSVEARRELIKAIAKLIPEKYSETTDVSETSIGAMVGVERTDAGNGEQNVWGFFVAGPDMIGACLQIMRDERLVRQEDENIPWTDPEANKRLSGFVNRVLEALAKS